MSEPAPVSPIPPLASLPGIEPPQQPAAMTPLDWVSVGAFGIILLTLLFPWFTVHVELMGNRISASAGAAVSHVPFWAFVTLLASLAVIGGTLFRQQSVWLDVARLPAAGLVLLVMLVAWATATTSGGFAGGDMGMMMLTDVAIYPSGLWIVAFLAGLAGAAALTLSAMQTGFAAFRRALAASPLNKPVSPTP